MSISIYSHIRTRNTICVISLKRLINNWSNQLIQMVGPLQTYFVFFSELRHWIFIMWTWLFSQNPIDSVIYFQTDQHHSSDSDVDNSGNSFSRLIVYINSPAWRWEPNVTSVSNLPSRTSLSMNKALDVNDILILFNQVLKVRYLIWLVSRHWPLDGVNRCTLTTPLAESAILIIVLLEREAKIIWFGWKRRK